MSAWTPNREELAWAAGLFDGEGYAGRARSKGWAGAVLTVVQACTPPIEANDEPPAVLTRFQEAFGIEGRFRYVGASSTRIKHRWDLRIARFEDVQHVVAAMWPWLGPVKREQCAHALGARSENQPWPRTHCKNRHEFTPENTHIEIRAGGGKVRICRTCKRLAQRESRLRRIAREPSR